MISGRLFEVSAVTRPGEWTFVVGESFIVGIRAVHDLDALRSFDSLMLRADARVEELVAAMPRSDADGSFVIVAEITEPGGDETGVTVVVRGDAAVDVFSVGGARRVTDRGIRPWLLLDFQATTAIVIGSGVDPLAEIDRLDRTQVSDTARVFQAGGLAWSVGAGVGQAVGQAEPCGAQAEPESGFAPTGRPGRADIDDDTVLVPSLQVSQSWTPPPVPDARTASPVTSTVYCCRVGTHEMLLTDTVYIGRNPGPPRIRSSETSQLVAVDSATREVSGTHLKLEQVGDIVVATDLASSNGTVVTMPGAAPVRLRSTESLVVTPGTRLDIGDGNIVEILDVVSAPGARTAESAAETDR